MCLVEIIWQTNDVPVNWCFASIHTMWHNFDQSALVVVDDLMSLLDAGMHADHPGVIIDSDAMFGENMFGYSALRGRAAMRSRVGMFTAEMFQAGFFNVQFLSQFDIKCCIQSNVSAMSDSDFGDQYMFITILTMCDLYLNIMMF